MPRRLTHEEFMEKFYIKNKNADNIEILGEYKGNRTKIKCRCKIDGYEWEIIPSSLLSGTGCPKCSGNIKNKTTEYFINELKEINSDIEILGEYVSSKTKIKCKCKIDGYEWEATPNNLLRGYGCPKCGGTMKLTHEEFINRIKEINNDIEILGKYVNNRTKIKCKCKIDNYIWETTPNCLLSGQGCPRCAGRNKTTEEFKQEMKKINDNIEILEEYKGTHKKIKCRCKIDGYEWETTPNTLLNGHGCPKCAGKIKNKTTEYFINELKEINDDIEIIGEYKGNNIKIKCKCKKDNFEWETTPSSLLSGTGCPKCSASKGEKRIGKYLDSENIEYITQHKFDECRSRKKLPFDFYIPSLNMAIEYDGEDHYMIFKRNKNESYEEAIDRFIGRKVKDTIKTIYCKENNIKLIRIPYWDFDKIEEILEKEL